jgi:heat shock protein HslJ
MTDRRLEIRLMSREPRPSRQRHTSVSRSLLAPLIFGLTTLALAACGASDDDAAPVTDPSPPTQAPPTTQPPVDLDGREMLSTSVEGYPLVEGTVIRLSFADGALSANAGCNTIFGGYQVDEDRLVLSELGTTEMACEPELMAQDRWLTDILNLEPRIALDNDTLTMRGAGGATLEFMDRSVVEPDLPIENTRWVLDGIRTQDAVSTVPEGVVASITIEGDQALVEAGCNRGSASVAIGEDTITFGPLALTKMMCEPPAMEVESAISTVFDGEVTYRIDADRLTVDSADTGTSDGEYTGTGLLFLAEPDEA